MMNNNQEEKFTALEQQLKIVEEQFQRSPTTKNQLVLDETKAELSQMEETSFVRESYRKTTTQSSENSIVRASIRTTKTIALEERFKVIQADNEEETIPLGPLDSETITFVSWNKGGNLYKNIHQGTSEYLVFHHVAVCLSMGDVFAWQEIADEMAVPQIMNLLPDIDGDEEWRYSQHKYSLGYLALSWRANKMTDYGTPWFPTSEFEFPSSHQKGSPKNYIPKVRMVRFADSTHMTIIVNCHLPLPKNAHLREPVLSGLFNLVQHFIPVIQDIIIIGDFNVEWDQLKGFPDIFHAAIGSGKESSIRGTTPKGRQRNRPRNIDNVIFNENYWMCARIENPEMVIDDEDADTEMDHFPICVSLQRLKK